MIDTTEKRFGLLGKPLGHSLSPALHKYLLSAAAQKGRYDVFEVDENRISAEITGMRAARFLGFNVTIPYKQAIMGYLDAVDEEAEFIGAVNTVFFKGNQLLGFNTDGRGFIAAIKKSNVTLESGSAIILGAGGAARAVIFELVRSGISRLFIFNRTRERMENLVRALRERFPSVVVDSGDLNRAGIDAALNNSHLMINTTSIGMWPDVAESPYFFAADASGKVAMDLVYNPLQTRFLRSAWEAGAKTIDGLDMFILQGAASLKIWLEAENAIEFDHEQLRNHLSSALRTYGHN